MRKVKVRPSYPYYTLLVPHSTQISNTGVNTITFSGKSKTKINVCILETH